MSFDFLSLEFHLRKLDKLGDPLRPLDEAINWEMFRPTLEQIRPQKRKSKAGRKPFDAVIMFKILILQSLYNFSDDAMEFHIVDRTSFKNFLGLELGDTVPDAKTIWLFRERLIEEQLIETLFEGFHEYLDAKGLNARKGQIVDASIVEAPRQRNTREENEIIKNGETPAEWSEKPAKERQKDVDARWVKKNNTVYYGYKNHIEIDNKHKLIRRWGVTHAAVHDSQIFAELIDESNTSAEVWADSAYRTPDILATLEKGKYREHIQRKGVRGKPLSDREKAGNRTRSKVRSRIEHIFGAQLMRAGNLIIRTIGIQRARCKIGLRNLAYNMERVKVLRRVAP